MPLDRLITVRLEALGKRVEGKYVDGPITVLRVWAERISSASTDAASAEREQSFKRLLRGGCAG